jgi:site-specific DNA-methyltransferase (adenine-specific)
VSVIHGDALTELQRLEPQTVDAIVTDPPYASGGFTESARRQAIGQGLLSHNLREHGWFVGDQMGTSGLMWLLRSMAFEATRVLVPGGVMCVFCDWRQVANIAPAMESAGLRLSNLVVWNKGVAGLGTGFRAQHEMCLVLTNGSGVYHSVEFGNVLTVPRMNHNDREHWTQKPVELMRRIVRTAAPEGGLVVDPFGGSGSTAVACVLEARRFLLVERDPAICELARDRIAEAQTGSRDRGEQIGLFGGAA